MTRCPKCNSALLWINEYRTSDAWPHAVRRTSAGCTGCEWTCVTVKHRGKVVSEVENTPNYCNSSVAG